MKACYIQAYPFNVKNMFSIEQTIILSEVFWCASKPKKQV